MMLDTPCMRRRNFSGLQESSGFDGLCNASQPGETRPLQSDINEKWNKFE